ncbi:MAG: hypothetical protein J2P22_08290 [Nocardioides sp.]|nr:hypothetical protein [Nocardioides sp.]
MSAAQPDTTRHISTLAVVGAAVVALAIVTVLILVAQHSGGDTSPAPTIQMPNQQANSQYHRSLHSGLQLGQP